MSTTQSRIWRSTYRDSVALMRLSTSVSDLPGVIQAAVVMGTPQNRQVLAEAGLDLEAAVNAQAEDLVAVVSAATEEAARAALQTLDAHLQDRPAVLGSRPGTRQPHTFRQALETLPEANLALISTPGEHAAAEALRALKRGLNVMIFSDHVPIAEEVELKRYAARQGLLVMGPDCGTAIIRGTPLAFANRVRRGSVGVVGASGTGIQQITTLLHRLGAGVSHAIGVGSRDLSDAVGGQSMLQAIDLLLADGETEVLVLLSKPCSPKVAERVLARVRQTAIPSVVCFLGAEDGLTLEEAAVRAAGLALGRAVTAPTLSDADQQRLEAFRPAPGQRYLRGLYAGGTLAYEAMCLLSPQLGPIMSNIPLQPQWQLELAGTSAGHTFIDFGDDEFTQGRPHPMIDFRLRIDRLRQEAADPDTLAILLDVTIGSGAHPDPAGLLAPAIRGAIETAAAGGRSLAVIAAVIGTDEDAQQLTQQEERLREAGAVVCPTAAAAARAAAWLVTRTALQTVKEGTAHD